MAGHSKWANIKHRKGRQDAKRSREWSKCSRAIIVAARGGGGDAAMNLALRYAIDDAKAANMPKDTIQKAVEKGAGGGDGAAYEEALYEGYGPGGVAILLKILTDNRNRTAAEIRKLFDKHNGNLGASGCVAYLFTPKGEIYLEKTRAREEQLMEIALEAGAEDIEDDDEAWRITTEPSDYQPLRDALEAADLSPHWAELSMIASTTVTLSGDEARKLLNFIDALEDQDDVQKIHANFEISQEDWSLQ